MSPPPLHTAQMRRLIAAVLASDDPAITAGARRAAALALSHPAALSDGEIAELGEALTRSTGPPDAGDDPSLLPGSRGSDP